MKAELYSVKICDGIMGRVHGAYFAIDEIYVPSIKTSLNVVSGNIHCFRTDPERYAKASKLRDVEIPDVLVNAMEKYLASTRDMSELAEVFFKDNNIGFEQV